MRTGSYFARALVLSAFGLFVFSCGGEEKKKCEAGSIGCECLANSQCNLVDGKSTTCLSNLCVECTEGSAGCPPKEPKCFSPCKSSFARADGTIAVCSPEGLMDGCLNGAVCKQGACVAPEAEPVACENDLGCPDFQACLSGRCMSNCSADGDCGSGSKCFRHVCRTACTTTDNNCGKSQRCDTKDGTAGVCMPAQVVDAPPQALPGAFNFSVTSLSFSNLKVSAGFEITNDAPSSQEFLVKKIEHKEFSGSGFTVIKNNPLHWLSMGETTPTKVQEFTMRIDGNGGKKTIKLGDAFNDALNRWEGVIEVSNATMGSQRIDLFYISKPEGQWTGRMFYFASFPDTGLSNWTSNKTSTTALAGVGNAFVQRWAAFKAGQLTYDELKAVMTSTQNESWKWAAMKKYCPADNVACYPYNNPQGFSTYSGSITQYPIPSGLSEFPFALNLKSDATDGKKLAGRVVSAQSLHYAGDSAVEIELEQDPASCRSTTSGAVLCDVKKMGADVLVGGRYVTSASDTACTRTVGNSFTLQRTPWLVPGFLAGTEVDAKSGLNYRYECVDKLLPFGDKADQYAINSSFAQSNPIPDGRARRRRLEAFDGALVNNSDMVILFRESFPSFLGSNDNTGFSAYGFMVLQRGVADLDPDAFIGAKPTDSRQEPTSILNVSCSSDVLNRAQGSTTLPTAAVDIQALVSTLIDGVKTTGGAPTPIDPLAPSGPKVHYYCEDTGLFDGGKDDHGGSNATKIACPSGSRVLFFTIEGLSQAQIAALPCQQGFAASSVPGEIKTRGTCQDVINQWLVNSAYSLKLDPVWTCTNSSQAFCSQNRLDLRADKAFYPPAEPKAVFTPLQAEIDNAFRYKTRFRNRQGKSVGFAPQICPEGSDAVPYCYDPGAIQQAKERVDCVLSLYLAHAGVLGTVKPKAQKYLKDNFSFTQEIDPSQPLPIVHDGFERLNAELLIMMGDESYTRAFASRFDLAGSSLLSFEGNLFEPNGISLSGGAGYEMYNLYQAVQYYQLALDRFYAMSPLIWQSISTLPQADGFITKDSVVSYFDRLIRASSQKSRAASEIAKRYQSFNRPDLARLVVQRAYTAAYLEAIVLSRMMLKLESVVLPEDRPQLVSRVENAQLVYSSALLNMREVFSDITDNKTVFGYLPEYVPFPALDDGDPNAFRKVLETAKAKLDTAAQKEELALSSSRSFETDAALFQSELVSVRNNYENQLADICGTFPGDDGRVYPAIAKYAYLNRKAAAIGDPCGFAGNGQLFQAMAAVDGVRNEFQALRVRHDNLTARINNEKARVVEYCNLVNETAEYQYEATNKIGELQDVIDTTNMALSAVKRTAESASTIAELTKCSIIVGTAGGGDCPTAAAAAVIFTGLAAATEIASVAAEIALADTQAEIGSIEQDTARWVTMRECDYAKANSKAEVFNMLLEYKEIEVESYGTQIRFQAALAEIIRLRSQATRIAAEQQEVEQLTINVEAARNDPNVRIYKNDAILTADRTFQAAVREAYRATKVFEYYTSQSYAHRDELFLVRMVGSGDISLEAYLANLEDAFVEFEEQFGRPDERVAIISLREDILQVPRMSKEGRALTENERLALMRTELTNGSHLDKFGYISFPFATNFNLLSPLTRNHKVKAIEVEVIGSEIGDTLGRVYLRQKGTGVVRPVAGDDSFFAFPQRTSVLNPFFNGEKVFNDTVYANTRLRDRPFVNTHWELVLNQKDELANQDINLNSVTDIRLYVTYSDFTQL